ncbi:LANO_0D04544g1_1 [Lachancea nothofagi CBS 11611]|uniref:LANO_0D04544g1_1 n=1 Tax=Lachancea nothofagi CBS 11611 TaxID=1266666 RepID=A0A1G4JH29_9SACH|nr:LANO_0D04544g1_1 [Lachancea nothofagi CBS 11611]
MSSCVFILDEQLNLLILKNFKSIPNPEAFALYFKKVYDPNNGPIVSHRGIVYVQVCRDGLFYVSVVLGGFSFNVMTILVYLSDFHTLLRKYLQVEQVDRTSIVDNFNLIYELLDESHDFGIPQLTDYNIIRDFIKIKPNIPLKDPDAQSTKSDDSDDESERTSSKVKLNKDKSNKHGLQDDEQYINSFILRATTQAISWRPKGIYYAKNELFVDIMEYQTYLMDFKRSQVRKSFVQGKINCRSYLSGMPKVKICVNKMLKNKDVFLGSAKFHQCVSLESLNNQDYIEFTPPDGEFQLCEYKLKRHINDSPVIKVIDYKISKRDKKQKVKLHLVVEPHFKTQNSATYLNIHIPVQSIFRDYNIDLKKPPRFKCDFGSVEFSLTEQSLIWKAPGMKGGHGEVHHSMHVEFFLFDEVEDNKTRQMLQDSMDPPPLREGLHLDELYAQINDTEKDAARDLITVEYEVPYYACSGLKVEYLKIEEEQLQYQSFPWVRYKTINDTEYAYQI